MGLGGEEGRKLNVLIPSSNARNELGGGYLSVPVDYFFLKQIVSSLSHIEGFRGSGFLRWLVRWLDPL